MDTAPLSQASPPPPPTHHHLHYPPLPSWSVHIPQLRACVLQTAVKQPRLECVTARIAAQGHVRSLLPLRTEFKEIINRFEFRADSSWKGGNFTPEYSHVLLFSFHTQMIKYLLTHFPQFWIGNVFLFFVFYIKSLKPYYIPNVGTVKNIKLLLYLDIENSR